jgi:hypothetical protein
MIPDVNEKLCPKCGAYWRCDCRFDEPPPVDWRAASSDGGCQHDWTEVLGVELDQDIPQAEAQVLLCRLCGLYAVERV